MHVIKWLWLFFIVSGVSLTTMAATKHSYIVGSQDIAYYPHYDFGREGDKGYAWAVLQAFAQHSGYHFEYRSYPIKRLQRALVNASIDFAYPDNKGWRALPSEVEPQTILSQPLITAISGTLVLEKHEFDPIGKFSSLVVPHGFTPVHWLDRIAQKRLNLVEVNTPIAALNLVLKGRVDGADIEYNVAQHLWQSTQQKSVITLAKMLPHGPVTFHLATIHQGNIIQQLNTFISNNQALMTKLRKFYRLIEPNELNGQ